MKPTEPALPYFKLFRFATTKDKLLMAIGTIFSIINGATMPLFMYILGDMINSFTILSNKDQIVDAASRQSIYFICVGVGSLICSWIMFACWMITGER